MVINSLLKNGTLSIKNLNASWGKIAIASCGRSDASSGTEGSYDIYDGETKTSDDYVVQATGQNIDSGALGSVTIKVVKTT
ncbi:hypothetical protein B0H67DRAFT_647908 [Lasiosphaeris hirsuta]|uniref:Uncharacterized protein n=1 Tax=Lasiosphaeris hirsuta TaxID=260670 RepID=A0AA40A1V5_9PEZI|nr:hypothetical protein B0H67DRAFT_647908 [Lasiosphaeris hirsuta]